MSNKPSTTDQTPLATAPARSTPRTDALLKTADDSDVFVELARQLEREAADLLAALEGAFKQLDETYGLGISNGYWPDIAPLYVQIRAAIKKARG